MYRYYNPNPERNYANDCVIRALCKVLNKTWDDVYDMLWEAGKKAKEIPTTNWVWESLLESRGYIRVFMQCATNCPTVDQFSRHMRAGKYVLCTGTHVVAVVDGDYYDAWDSGGARVQYYFSER